MATMGISSTLNEVVSDGQREQELGSHQNGSVGLYSRSAELLAVGGSNTTQANRSLSQIPPSGRRSKMRTRARLTSDGGFENLKNWREVTLALSLGAVVALLSSERANAVVSNLLANWFSYETPYSIASKQQEEMEALQESYEFQAESWEYAELAVAEHVAAVAVSIETLIEHKMEAIPKQIVPFSGATEVVSSSLFEVDELCNISNDLNKLSEVFAIEGDASSMTEECVNWKSTIASVKLKAFDLKREIDNAANKVDSASETAIEEAIDFLCATFEVFCPAVGTEQKLY